MKIDNFLNIFVLVIFNNLLLMSQNNTQKSLMIKPDNQNIHYTGRIDFTNPQRPKLSSPGAYFNLNFKGSSCTILLENEFEGSGYNYISVVCDGKCAERIKVEKGVLEYKIADGLEDGEHSLLVCKATESFNGYIELQGILCEEILLLKSLPLHTIEFIGDSYTCGALSDTSLVRCGKGNYHDNHNAYFAYGPLLARNLKADWVLSSVSGMGLTRNWNNEGPALPSFYNNLYLNADFSITWPDKEFAPELVTIMLGVNDHSLGDGSYNRKPPDSTKFVNEYIIFVKRIRAHYPTAIICCLNIPTVSGEFRERFAGYLDTVVTNIKKTTNDSNLYTFTFSDKYESGCNGHPSIEEHEKIANELLPYLKKITGW